MYVTLWITLSDFKISMSILIYQSLTVVLSAAEETVLYNRLSLSTEMINWGVVGGEYLKNIKSTEFK